MLRNGQKVIVKGKPLDFKRIDREGTILNKVAFEHHYYRVKIGNSVEIVNDSMLEIK